MLKDLKGNYMNNKIIIIVVLVAVVVSISGCIQSDTSQINSVSPTINNHLKNGDVDFNNAVVNTNNFQYIQALSNCENASSEYNTALSSAQQAATYAANSNDPVLVNYTNLVTSEINAKINATSQLQIAITYLAQNDTVDANNHIDEANEFMANATEFSAQRNTIIKQNPTKFN